MNTGEKNSWNMRFWTAAILKTISLRDEDFTSGKAYWRNSKKTENVGVIDETLRKTKQKQNNIAICFWTSDTTTCGSYRWTERDMTKKVDSRV